MKDKEFTLANAILVLIIMFAAYATFNVYSNVPFNVLIKKEAANLFGLTSSQHPESSTNCAEDAQHTIDSSENDKHLVKLSQYEAYCNSFVTESLMLFTSFPTNEQDSLAKSRELSLVLRKYHQYKIKPIIIVEPYLNESLLNYDKFLQGDYDSALDKYFDNLKKLGISNEMLGIWVPFPESNTPNWDNKNTEPNDFALAVNKYFKIMTKYYPTYKGSILLSAITYTPNDLNWENGDYLDLGPYIQNINHAYISSIGIQGFPWIADATRKPRSIFHAHEFLQPDIAISAAQELRTKDIWFNTGTFREKYTNSEEKRIKVSVNERKNILWEILDVASYVKNYQQNEYRVTINLFSEDKSRSQEATDWSYLKNKDEIQLFKEFIQYANEKEIPVSIFDQAE